MTSYSRHDPITASVDPKLFSRTIIFSGIFTSGALATKPHSIEIRYSLINAHQPIGVIRGSRTEYEDLYQFTVGKSEVLCALESTSSAETRQRISSDRVLFRDHAPTFYMNYDNTVIHQVIGIFEPLTFRIDNTYDRPSSGERRMIFYLSGPTLVWRLLPRRFSVNKRELTITASKAVLNIQSFKDLRVLAGYDYVHASHSHVRHLADPYDQVMSYTQSLFYHHVGLKASIFTLTIVDKDPIQTDEEFTGRAHEAVDLLQLLFSFLSKTKIDWFASCLHTMYKTVQTYREMTPPLDPEIWPHNVVLHMEDVRRFVDKAFKAYACLVKGGVDLRLPINLYISARFQQTVNSQFVTLFLSLEKLSDSMNRMFRREPLLRSGEMKALRKLVGEKLREFNQKRVARDKKDKLDIQAVNDKIAELQRPSFKAQINKNLDQLGVAVADIGGMEGVARMIKLRNSLMHSADEPDIRLMYRERQRLETIVERILLRLLGWRGRTNTPTIDNRIIEIEE